MNENFEKEKERGRKKESTNVRIEKENLQNKDISQKERNKKKKEINSKFFSDGIGGKKSISNNAKKVLVVYINDRNPRCSNIQTFYIYLHLYAERDIYTCTCHIIYTYTSMSHSVQTRYAHTKKKERQNIQLIKHFSISLNYITLICVRMCAHRSRKKYIDAVECKEFNGDF